MSPVAAFVVVISHSIVLFLFASQGISNFLQSINLPSIPLVPVSSSQAVVGGVIGIGLLKGGKESLYSNLKIVGRSTHPPPTKHGFGLFGLVRFLGVNYEFIDLLLMNTISPQ